MNERITRLADRVLSIDTRDLSKDLIYRKAEQEFKHLPYVLCEAKKIEAYMNIRTVDIETDGILAGRSFFTPLNFDPETLPPTPPLC